MSNYIYYIDDRAMRIGDLASDLGDYRSAIRNYCIALDKLRKYQGDMLQPMVMAGDLINNIKNLKTRPFSKESILSWDTWKLTKSSFVKADQCVKYLFSDKHKKHKKTPFTLEILKLFNQGCFFEVNITSANKDLERV